MTSPTIAGTREDEGVLVLLSGERTLLRMRELREIVPRVALAPYVGAPADVLGLLNLRGEVLTVVCAGPHLGRRPTPAPAFFAVVEGRGVRFCVAVEAVVRTVRATEGVSDGAWAEVGAMRVPILDVDRLAECLFETEGCEDERLNPSEGAAR